MATIKEILAKSPEERRREYGVKGVFTDNNGNEVERYIDKVVIDGNPFTDYSAFSFLWEKSYVKSPVRSGDGTIGNLNSYATFITPHLKIDFSLMSIDSYRILMNLIYEKNEFEVECYDIVNNTTTVNKMYFTTEEMPKLWTIVDALNGDENAIMLLGVQDYTVEMVGTNASFDTVEVLYYDNNGVLISEATQSVDKGTEVIINYDFVAPVGYRFDGQWENEVGAIVRNGDVLRITKNIKLKAKIVSTNEYTLSFSYGNGNTPYSQMSEPLNSVTITYGETIQDAVEKASIKLNSGNEFTFPENGTGSISVKYDNAYYTPYEFKGWYLTPIANNATRVYGSTVYDYNLNRTIYQIYEPIKYSITFNTNTNGAIELKALQVAYGSAVALPVLSISGYTFIDWFTTSDFKDKTQFSGTTMPPKDLTLYAKWEKNS